MNQELNTKIVIIKWIIIDKIKSGSTIVCIQFITSLNFFFFLIYITLRYCLFEFKQSLLINKYFNQGNLFKLKSLFDKDLCKQTEVVTEIISSLN
jgi:hypothetical protein